MWTLVEGQISGSYARNLDKRSAKCLDIVGYTAASARHIISIHISSDILERTNVHMILKRRAEHLVMYSYGGNCESAASKGQRETPKLYASASATYTRGFLTDKNPAFEASYEG